MDKNSRGMIIPWIVVRDVLYQYAAEVCLTCKIASLVIDKNSRGMIIPWIVVRDVLYQYAVEVCLTTVLIYY
jgi:antitoxin component of MazEF toxin-antitoxin module